MPSDRNRGSWTWGMVHGEWVHVLLAEGVPMRRSEWFVDERMGIEFDVWFLPANTTTATLVQTFHNLGEAKDFAEASYALTNV